MSDNKLTTFPTGLIDATQITTVVLSKNYIDCGYVGGKFPRATCSEAKKCSDTCDESFCQNGEGECQIQCSDGLYRIGDYCYFADLDNVPGCTEGSWVSICTHCPAGHGTPSCSPCTLNTWSDGEMECTAIENCKTSTNTEQMCTECNAGYGLSTDQMTCTPCTGNTWSDGSTGCQDGQAHCTESDHTAEKCVKCDGGYELKSDGTCEACAGTHYTVYNETFPGGACTEIPNCMQRENETQPDCNLCANTYILDTNKQCVPCEYGYSSNGVDTCYKQDEQEALNKFADILSQARKTECTPPVLVECQKSPESPCTGGEGCGTYEVTVENTHVVGLRIVENSLPSLPTEIGHLSALTSLHAKHCIQKSQHAEMLSTTSFQIFPMKYSS